MLRRILLTGICVAFLFGCGKTENIPPKTSSPPQVSQLEISELEKEVEEKPVSEIPKKTSRDSYSPYLYGGGIEESASRYAAEFQLNYENYRDSFKKGYNAAEEMKHSPRLGN